MTSEPGGQSGSGEPSSPAEPSSPGEPSNGALATSPAVHVVRYEPTDPNPTQAAPVVLAIHGAMDRGTSFRRLARALPERTVLGFDRRGYARSLAVPLATSLDDHVQDAISVLERSSVHSSAPTALADAQVVVFGHSFGGVVALRLAELRPDLVCHVIVYEAPLPWLDWWPGSTSMRTGEELGPEAAAEAFLGRFLGERIWSRMPESTRAERRLEGLALMQDSQMLRMGRWPYEPKNIFVPVTIGCGELSLPIHRQGAKFLFDVLTEAQANGTDAAAVRFEEIPGAKHGAHLSHSSALAGTIRSVRGCQVAEGPGRLPRGTPKI